MAKGKGVDKRRRLLEENDLKIADTPNHGLDDDQVAFTDSSKAGRETDNKSTKARLKAAEDARHSGSAEGQRERASTKRFR